MTINENIEGFVGLVTAAILGTWAAVNRLRVNHAKTRDEIAKSDVESTTAEGYAAEIKRLSTALEQLQPLSKRVAQLEAKLTGIAVYCELLLLCDSCMTNNKPLIDKIRAMLEPVMFHPTEDNQQAQIVKEFLAKRYNTKPEEQ